MSPKLNPEVQRALDGIKRMWLDVYMDTVHILWWQQGTAGSQFAFSQPKAAFLMLQSPAGTAAEKDPPRAFETKE